MARRHTALAAELDWLAHRLEALAGELEVPALRQLAVDVRRMRDRLTEDAE